jgi:hypothetical protein
MHPKETGMRFLTSRPWAGRAAGTAGAAVPAPARVRLLTWPAAIGIGSAIPIMIGLLLLRDSWACPPIVLPAAAGLVVLGLTGRWKRREPDADAGHRAAA